MLFAIPVVAVTLAMMLAATIIWAVLMVVVMVLGGAGARRTARRLDVHPPRTRLRAASRGRRRPRSYWA